MKVPVLRGGALRLRLCKHLSKRKAAPLKQLVAMRDGRLHLLCITRPVWLWTSAQAMLCRLACHLRRSLGIQVCRLADLCCLRLTSAALSPES